MSAADLGGSSGGPGSAAGPAGASGSDLALDAATASSIAGCHDTAAGRITGLASSVPSVDGGYGTADLNAILAKILRTADQLAQINEAAASQIRKVADHFDGTDAEVATGFGNMAGTSWPYGAATNPATVTGSDPWGTP